MARSTDSPMARVAETLRAISLASRAARLYMLRTRGFVVYEVGGFGWKSARYVARCVDGSVEYGQGLSLDDAQRSAREAYLRGRCLPPASG